MDLGMLPEEVFVRAFVAPNRRQRWLDAVVNPSKRGRVLGRLDNTSDFIESYSQEYRPAGHGNEMVADISATLKRLGAGDACNVISAMQSVDGQALPVDVALVALLGRESGVLICVPEHLALYLPEPPGRPVILSRSVQRS